MEKGPGIAVSEISGRKISLPGIAAGQIARRHVAARWRRPDEAHLTPLEYRVLGIVVRTPGAIVTHEKLFREAWGPGNDGEQPGLSPDARRRVRDLDPIANSMYTTLA